MTDFVHPGYVRSKNDGDVHWVTGKALIALYGLNPATTVIVDSTTFVGRSRNQVGDRHFHVRFNGDYKKDTP